MTYDDIRKDLSLWTDFLLPLKKDISSGQIRGYPNVLNALIKLDIIIRSLKKILDKQDNKAIHGSYDDIKNSIKEIRDIVSDSIGKPASWIKVTGRLESFIAELNDLSELLAETSQSQPRSEEKDGQSKTNIPKPPSPDDGDHLRQIKSSEIQTLVGHFKKLHKLIKTKLQKDRHLWEKLYDQVCADIFAEMGKQGQLPMLKVGFLTEKKYCQVDVNYAKAISQKQEKIGKIINEIEPILRSNSVEPLLRYDRKHGDNLRIIIRQIIDHTKSDKWYFTPTEIRNAILFLLQVKAKLPLWYDTGFDRLDEQKPAETEQDILPTKDKKKKAKIACLFKKIIGWIFKKTSHVIGAVIIAIIVVILVDIFADFGWIERIKAVIYKILQLN